MASQVVLSHHSDQMEITCEDVINTVHFCPWRSAFVVLSIAQRRNARTGLCFNIRFCACTQTAAACLSELLTHQPPVPSIPARKLLMEAVREATDEAAAGSEVRACRFPTRRFLIESDQKQIASCGD